MPKYEHQHQGQVNIKFPKGVQLTAAQKADIQKQLTASTKALLNKHAALAGKKVSLVNTITDKNTLF